MLKCCPRITRITLFRRTFQEENNSTSAENGQNAKVGYDLKLFAVQCIV